jgi:hypothetical protein
MPIRTLSPELFLQDRNYFIFLIKEFFQLDSRPLPELYALGNTDLDSLTG